MSEQETHSIHHDHWELEVRHEDGAAIAELWTYGANVSETKLNTAGTGEITVIPKFTPHAGGNRRTKCSESCQCGWELKSRQEGDDLIAEIWAHGTKLSESTLDGNGGISVRTA